MNIQDLFHHNREPFYDILSCIVQHIQLHYTKLCICSSKKCVTYCIIDESHFITKYSFILLFLMFTIYLHNHEFHLYNYLTSSHLLPHLNCAKMSPLNCGYLQVPPDVIPGPGVMLLVMTGILASDWSILVTWSQYWPLIGKRWWWWELLLRTLLMLKYGEHYDS